jgi:hypothetical protein
MVPFHPVVNYVVTMAVHARTRRESATYAIQ